MLHTSRNHYPHLSAGNRNRSTATEDNGMPAFQRLAREAADHIRLGDSTQDAFVEMASFIQAHPSEDQLSASVSALLATNRLAGQFAVRTCRSTFSIDQAGPDVSLILMAIPCVIAKWNSTAGDTVNPEIQGWIRSKWLGFDHDSVKVTVSNQPIPVEALDDTMGGAQLEWAKALANTGNAPATWPFKAPAPFTAAVWMVALQVPSTLVDSVQVHLQQAGLRDSSSSAFKHRIEALSQEKGALVNLLAPTSWANAFSMARAAAFRQQAAAVSRGTPAGTVLPVHYNGNELYSYTPSGKVLPWGTFPEETLSDLKSMIARTEDATGLRLPLTCIQ